MSTAAEPSGCIPGWLRLLHAAADTSVSPPRLEWFTVNVSELPVEVAQQKTRYLPAAQPVNGQKEQDGSGT